MAITKASNRLQLVTVANNGDILEFGPGGSDSNPGAMVFQFACSGDFVGNFMVHAKIAGVAGVTAPHLPMPYRRVNVAGAASDYLMVADLISASGIIQVPSNGLAISMLVTITAGTVQVYSWDVGGASSV